MAGRGNVSLYMIFLVMTFGTIGLISFQTLKEKKNLAILLVTKYKEIDDLSNRYEELLEATKKSLLQAKEEKDNLIYKVKELENNDRIRYTMCKEDKEKYKIKKNQEMLVLKEKLQAKDIELAKSKAKVELLKLDNKKVDAKVVIKTVGRDDPLDEEIESFTKSSENKDKNSLSLKTPKEPEEKMNDVWSVAEESNIVNDAKVEDAKIDSNFEVDKRDGANLEENEHTTTITTSKANLEGNEFTTIEVIEEDDDKESLNESSNQ